MSGQSDYRDLWHDYGNQSNVNKLFFNERLSSSC